MLKEQKLDNTKLKKILKKIMNGNLLKIYHLERNVLLFYQFY